MRAESEPASESAMQLNFDLLEQQRLEDGIAAAQKAGDYEVSTRLVRRARELTDRIAHAGSSGRRRTLGPFPLTTPFTLRHTLARLSPTNARICRHFPSDPSGMSSENACKWTKEELERYLAEGLSLGADRQAGRQAPDRRSSYHLKKHGLKPVNADKYSPNARVRSPRAPARQLVRQRASTRASLPRCSGSSISTVRHWLQQVLDLETATSDGVVRTEAQLPREAGRKAGMIANARHHGTTDVHPGRPGLLPLCGSVGARRSSRWRRRAQAAADRGGGLGVASSVATTDTTGHCSSTTSIPTAEGVSRSAMRATPDPSPSCAAEAEKCVLLCANCHAEVEAGVGDLLPRRALDGLTDA